MKKFGILLLVALAILLLLNSFKGGGNDPKLIIHSPKADKPIQPSSSNPKDIDVMAYCASLGIPTSVNETEIIERYGNVELSIALHEKVSFSFSNESASNYVLDIYDIDGNPVVTITDINNNNIALDAGFFVQGDYLYKLTGNGNTFAGKFSY